MDGREMKAFALASLPLAAPGLILCGLVIAERQFGAETLLLAAM